jgi:hypothetical protein
LQVVAHDRDISMITTIPFTNNAILTSDWVAALSRYHCKANLYFPAVNDKSENSRKCEYD